MTTPKPSSGTAPPHEIRNRSHSWLRSTARLANAAAPKIWRTLIAGWLVRSALTVVELLVLRTTGRRVVEGVNIDELVVPLILLAITLTLGGVLASAVAQGELVLLDRLTHYLDLELADNALEASATDLQNPTFHNQLARAQSASRTKVWQLITAFSVLALGSITMVGLVVVLGLTAPVLVVVAVVGWLPLWLAARRNTYDLHDFEYAYSGPDRERRELAPLLLSSTSALELRALGAGRYLRNEMDRLWKQRHAQRRKVNRRNLKRSLVASLTSSLLIAGGAALVFWLTSSGRLGLADAAVGVLVLRQIAAQSRALNASLSSAHDAQLFLEDLEAIIDPARVSAEPRSAPPTQPTAPFPPFETLRLEGVRYRYPAGDAWALDGIDLEIHRGEVLAFVGPNGSGKSTLAKLLTFLYPPTEGRILWDDIDVSTVNPDRLHPTSATMFQDVVRYPFSARDDIALGRIERRDDTAGVRSAAQRAGIDDVLQALPNGYETRLLKEFDGGVDLSGGQLQRVSLARAFFRDAEFLILDEPSAALDAHAEADLFDRVRALAAGRTVVVISHRFATVRRADRIGVLRHGRIIELGSHDELMAARGYYAEAFELQAAAYLDETSGPGNDL